MLNSLPSSCVFGMETADNGLTELEVLGRLATYLRAHDEFSVEVSAARGKLNRAAIYLRKPGCNMTLAAANLERLKGRHSAALTRLRANRQEARAFLRDLGRDPAAD